MQYKSSPSEHQGQEGIDDDFISFILDNRDEIPNKFDPAQQERQEELDEIELFLTSLENREEILSKFDPSQQLGYDEPDDIELFILENQDDILNKFDSTKQQGQDELNEIESFLTSLENQAEILVEFNPSQQSGQEGSKTIESIITRLEHKDELSSGGKSESLPQTPPVVVNRRKRKQEFTTKVDLNVRKCSRRTDGIEMISNFLMDLPPISPLLYSKAYDRYKQTREFKLLPVDELSMLLTILNWWGTNFTHLLAYSSLQDYCNRNPKSILHSTGFPATMKKRLTSWLKPYFNPQQQTTPCATVIPTPRLKTTCTSTTTAEDGQTLSATAISAAAAAAAQQTIYLQILQVCMNETNSGICRK